MARRSIVAGISTLMLAALPALVTLTALPANLLAQRHHYRDTDDEVGSRIDTTVALERGGTVDLSLVSGEIMVTSWDRNEVRVKATSEEGILRFDASPSRVAVGVRSNHGDMGDTRYEITIPATARLTSRSVSGNITTRGGSEVEAHSVSGDVSVSDASGRTTVESVSGGARATHIGGGLRANTVSGDLEISDITGDVDVQTTSGEIELTGIHSSYVHAETVSGDVRFSGSLDTRGTYQFRSHSGDVRLALPPTGASLSIQTFSGDIESDYPMTLQPGRREGGGRQRVEFTINGGGARVSAESFSGDITIERASGSGRED
jgi:DUF4097 and DUF4098 domain-containing protein YvlB